MFKIIPVYKDYLWGGTKLKTSYGKKSDLEIVAESWELSTHPAGTCLIEVDGKKQGLADYVKEQGKKVLGTKCNVEDEIPILIKLIDAKDNLSVQVHPDDTYAKRYENDLGKTEMWYVLEAEEGAKLVYGFKEALTPELFTKYIEENTLTDVLNFVDVHKGDTFFITPGTMHAIGKGIVIAEIQQSSNVTYRVYDYGRIGVDGKPRELHVDKAKQVTKLTKAEESYVVYTMEECEGYSTGLLAECEYFKVQRIDLKECIHLVADDESFHAIMVTEGSVVVKNEVEVLEVSKGESLFIPASTGAYQIEGRGEILLSTL